MITLLLIALLTKSPFLRITPEGNSVNVFSIRYPDKTDVEWEVVAVSEGFVERRYTVTVDGMDGDSTLRLTWRLAPNHYIIASCVYPRKDCATKEIEIR